MFKGQAKDAATTLKESSSPRTLKRLVYEVIKEDLQEGDVKLATGGCPIKIRKTDTVESNASKSQVLTHSHFDDFRLVNNLSINQTLGIARVMRQALGKESIQPNLVKHIQESNTKYANFFEAIMYEERPMVFCNDTLGFMDTIKQQRQDEPVLYKVGADLGRGQTKMGINACDSLEMIKQKSIFKQPLLKTGS